MSESTKSSIIEGTKRRINKCLLHQHTYINWMNQEILLLFCTKAAQQLQFSSPCDWLALAAAKASRLPTQCSHCTRHVSSSETCLSWLFFSPVSWLATASQCSRRVWCQRAGCDRIALPPWQFPQCLTLRTHRTRLKQNCSLQNCNHGSRNHGCCRCDHGWQLRISEGTRPTRTESKWKYRLSQLLCMQPWSPSTRSWMVFIRSSEGTRPMQCHAQW